MYGLSPKTELFHAVHNAENIGVYRVIRVIECRIDRMWRREILNDRQDRQENQFCRKLDWPRLSEVSGRQYWIGLTPVRWESNRKKQMNNVGYEVNKTEKHALDTLSRRTAGGRKTVPEDGTREQKTILRGAMRRNIRGMRFTNAMDLREFLTYGF